MYVAVPSGCTPGQHLLDWRAETAKKVLQTAGEMHCLPTVLKADQRCAMARDVKTSCSCVTARKDFVMRWSFPPER